MRTDVYLQVEPTWSHYRSRTRNPDGMKVVRQTRKKPDEPISGTIVVRLTLDIPTEAFMPLTPVATVVIPADLTIPTPVEVVATNPDE